MSGAKRKANGGSAPQGKKKAAAAKMGSTLIARMKASSSELKFFDTTLDFSLDATGEVPATGQLVLIPQGVTESTRVGRLCVIKSLQMRGLLAFVPAAGATAATHAFIYVVLDTQANGAAAAITDVLTSNVMTRALINLNNSQRFRILKRFVVPLMPGAGVTTAYNNTVAMVDYYTKLNVPLDFSSTAGALTEIRSNNIFLLAGSDATSDDTVVFAGTARVRFSDGS